MKTTKLYDEAPYDREFRAKVCDIVKTEKRQKATDLKRSRMLKRNLKENLKSYKFIISEPGGDAREVCSILKEKLDAKGGGSKEMVQGSVNAGRDSILEALNGRR